MFQKKQAQPGLKFKLVPKSLKSLQGNEDNILDHCAKEMIPSFIHIYSGGGGSQGTASYSCTSQGRGTVWMTIERTFLTITMKMTCTVKESTLGGPIHSPMLYQLNAHFSDAVVHSHVT